MTSVLMKTASLAALSAVTTLALGALALPPAAAADLGGDCCADLEERVAELEATTARKGNRQVSLTISGWVNEEILFWDDGDERNTYIGTNSLEQTRFRFTGKAKIDNDWSAGYTLEIGTAAGPSSAFSQTTDDGGNATNTFTVRQSNWWLKSETYGRLTVGQQGTATYHLLDDADLANTRLYADAEAAAVNLAAFQLRDDGDPIRGGLRWSDLLRGVNNRTPGQNGRRHVVRYDSPTWEGFTVTASWGEDDEWGGKLNYTNAFGDFKVKAQVGYEDSTDEGFNNGQCSTGPTGLAIHQDCHWWGAAATVMHVPTGLYVYGGYGEEIDNARQRNLNLTAVAIPHVDDKDSDWFVQGGIERKWLPLGTTTIFGEYRHDDPGSNEVSRSGVLTAIQSSDIENYAGGVVQNIDAAAMDFYVVYRHTDGNFTRVDGKNFDLDAFDAVIAGSLIQF